jgi:AcrR family transcriptional regulator
MNIHSQLDMAEILDKTKLKAGDDKRDRLLTAALELFVARGFDGVSVPEIAAKAGVAVGTVYRYFETKEALVNALYRRWKTLYNEIVLAPIPAGQSIRRQFGTYWQRMTLFARARPGATRFMDLHHHGDYLDEESRALSRKYREVAEAFIAEGCKSGQLRPLDPIMVVALMWGAAAGLVKFASQGALEFDARTATDMEDALWRAIAKD